MRSVPFPMKGAGGAGAWKIEKRERLSRQRGAGVSWSPYSHTPRSYALRHADAPATPESVQHVWSLSQAPLGIGIIHLDTPPVPALHDCRLCTPLRHSGSPAPLLSIIIERPPSSISRSTGTSTHQMPSLANLRVIRVSRRAASSLHVPFGRLVTACPSRPTPPLSRAATLARRRPMSPAFWPSKKGQRWRCGKRRRSGRGA